MGKLKQSRIRQTRLAKCTHCTEEFEVAQKAMSVFCPHCKKRVILEDFKIRTYHATRLFATCGDVLVEKKGFVSAPMRVENLTIKGRVQGDIKARGCVTIASTGEMRGDIRAPRLVVAGGAKLNGFCRITPEAHLVYPDGHRDSSEPERCK